MIQNAGVCESLEDILIDLGSISASRVLTTPPSGQASLADWQSANRSGKASFELVDGILVERAMGWRESMLAAALIGILRSFVVPRNFGVVAGADAFIELFPMTVRSPDVTFISWSCLPGGRLPDEAVPHIAPELVVEVLSPGNARGEMTRKRREYFQAGINEVWMIDPRERSVVAYTSSVSYEVLTEQDTIVCRNQLAGLTISLSVLFAELDRCGAAPRNP